VAPETNFTILPSALTLADYETHGRTLAAFTAIHEAGHFAARIRKGHRLTDLWIGSPDENEDEANRTFGYCVGSVHLIDRKDANEMLFWGPATEVLSWAKLSRANPSEDARAVLTRVAERGGVDEIPPYDSVLIGGVSR
jgi:hypothetical protein